MRFSSSAPSFTLFACIYLLESTGCNARSILHAAGKFHNYPRANKPINGGTSFHGQFYAGADFGTLLRQEAIPGRTFYDYDGETVRDPIELMSAAGINAVRVEAERGACVGPSHLVNDESTLGKELTFRLDWGCLDLQVKTVQRAVAHGMRVVLTINQGFNISKEMEHLDYSGMVANIQAETKRQLQPFLRARIVPDIILLENEGSDGFLYKEESTGHIRGVKDGKASAGKIDQELCGQIPTGNMVSLPQITGYYKAEILAANEAITAAGFSIATVRYGLHSHGQYVQWKESVIHGPKKPNQTVLKNAVGKTCTAKNVIPANILAHDVSTMLTITGFSPYPDPDRPTDIDSVAAMNATMARMDKTLSQLQGYAETYGKFRTGPFAGQYKLQGFGVEYSTQFNSKDAHEVKQEQALTEMMFRDAKTYSAFLGMMWYEPWYSRSDWEGGKAALCHNQDSKDGNIMGEVPTQMFKTWGAHAVSPWKGKKAVTTS